MKTNIEMKSALIGLALGVVATLAVGAASTGPAGRYQIAGTASHGLVIDTATGKVWSKYLPQNEGGTDAAFSSPKLGEK